VSQGASSWKESGRGGLSCPQSVVPFHRRPTGKMKIVVVLVSGRLRQASGKRQGELVRLWSLLLLSSIDHSIRFDFSPKSPPQTSLPGLAPVTISRGRCHH
jgi:hypothetical protein